MGGDLPPVLKEGAEYKTWKRELQLWVIGTSIKPEKQAAVAALRIEDRKARDFATRLSLEELGKVTGLNFLLGQLDAFFKEDTSQCLFMAIEKLETFFRTPVMGMHEYITEFGNRVATISELLGGGKKPYGDGVLAYRLLKQANLSQDQETLVRASMQEEVTCALMEKCLKRAFGDVVVLSGGMKAKEDLTCLPVKVIKTEPQDTFYNRSMYSRGSYPSHDRSGASTGYRGQGNSRHHHSDHSSHDTTKKKFDESLYKDLENIKDRDGNVKRCNVCDSKFHFANECPHNHSDNSDRMKK